MRVAIVGGTGTLGREVAREVATRGHEVRVLSRHAPDHRVDLTTGEGLDAALAGVDAVVDASNQRPMRRGPSVLVDGCRRLLAAEVTAEVGHHVCVSIVGCDRVPMGYYRTKVEQERLVEEGPVPWTIMRATQFHELVDTTLAAVARWRILPVPRMRLQTVSAADVARAIADVVEGWPRRGRVEVAGPQVADVRDLARDWRATSGRRALQLPVPWPGAVGRALRDGGLTTDHPDMRGTTTFATWLQTAR